MTETDSSNRPQLDKLNGGLLDLVDPDILYKEETPKESKLSSIFKAASKKLIN
jgi:hypothetical protein